MLYLVANTAEGGLGFSQEQAVMIYGLFTSFMYLGALPAGFIGDYLISSRTLCWVGGIVASAGLFLLTVPEPITAIAGLVLVSLGTSTYLPNHLASVGHSLRHNKKIIDAGYLIVALVVNLGALTAVMAVSTVLELYLHSYRVIFILLGALLLFAQLAFVFLLPVFPKEVAGPNKNLELEAPEPAKKRMGWPVTAALLFTMGMFWMCYEIIHFEFNMGHGKGGMSFLQQFVNPFLFFILTPIAVIMKLSDKISSVKLVLIGLMTAVVGATVGLKVSPETQQLQIIAFIVLFTIAEICISLIFGLLARYNSPRDYGKLYGIMFAFLSVTGMVASYSSMIFGWVKAWMPITGVAIIILIITMLLLWWSKKTGERNLSELS